MSIEKRIGRLLHFDSILFFPVLCLMVIGILFIFSSGVNSYGISVTNEYIKQIIWGFLAVFVIMVFSYVDYNLLYEFSFWLFIFLLFLLVATLMMGKVVNGAKAWLGIFGLGGQPSELAKITTILFLAKFLKENQSTIRTVKTFTKALTILFFPVVFILVQPDTGTSLVFFPIFFMMVLIAGGKFRHLFFVIALGLLALFLALLPSIETLIFKEHNGLRSFLRTPLLAGIIIGTILLIFLIASFGWYKYKKQVFYWFGYFTAILFIALILSFFIEYFLKNYQIMRFIVFLDPKIDPKGFGWNLIQSMTAIGSGGLMGKGFLSGTQSHYRFLPMQSTDFIFSILGEEWGFLGSLIVFLLYGLLIGRMLFIMLKIKDHYGTLVVSGFTGMLCAHLFINVGMAIGIMPIAGIPLYFVSYGGSSLLAACLAIGITTNIYIKRYMF